MDGMVMEKIWEKENAPHSTSCTGRGTGSGTRTHKREHWYLRGVSPW